MLISNEFSAFDADMFFAVELYWDVVDGETSWATASIDHYQSPMEKLISFNCLLLLTLSLEQDLLLGL